MKIFIASDHAGFEIKKKIVDYLKADSNKIIDLGPINKDPVDYPDFSDKVCQALEFNSTDIGILICGSGQGMVMRANKYSYIRGALCWNEETSILSRQHNNANVLCLGSRLVTEETIFKIINSFLSTSFKGERHEQRVKKISSLIHSNTIKKQKE